MSDIIPSAHLKVPANMEHVEARQAAIDRERMAYIETLEPEAKARFMVVEQVVLLLKEVKLPFFLFVHPEPNALDPKRRGVWNHQMAHYGDPFSSSEDLVQIRSTMFQTLVVAADLLATPLGMTVPICASDGKVFHMANPPAQPFSPPPDDYQRSDPPA